MRFWKVSAVSCFLSLLTLGLGTQPAYAITMLKQVHFQKGDELKLTFDSEVQAPQITMDYLNDIVQISIRDVGVYPAKMMSVSGEYVSKIFAYQYSPKLVRCRLSVRGKAADFKDRVQLKYSGKNLTIKVEHPVAQEQKRNEVLSDLNEEALSNKVIKDTSARSQANEGKEKNQGSHRHSGVGNASSENKVDLKAAKPLTSAWAVFAKMGLVLILFGLALFGIKWFKTSGYFDKVQISGLLGNLVTPQNVKEKTLIQVVSRCHIDPKKSLIVAKVGDRHYFLGVTPDSIGFLADLSGRGLETGVSASGKSVASEDHLQFSELFEDELGTSKSLIKSPVSSDTLNRGVRSRIRSRLEGLKPL